MQTLYYPSVTSCLSRSVPTALTVMTAPSQQAGRVDRATSLVHVTV